MAISFLELQRSTDGVVEPDDPVIFDTIVSSGGTDISYDTGTGEITFETADYYFIDWFVAPSFGLPTDGSNFAIITSADDPPLTGSSHVRVSPTVGFAILNVETPGMTARLVNMSDSALTLSPAVTAKAALAVFAVSGLNLAAPSP